MREPARGWAAASCALSGCSLRFSRVPSAPRGLRPAGGVRRSRLGAPPQPRAASASAPLSFLWALHRRGAGFPHRPLPLRAEFPGTPRHFWFSIPHALRGPRGSPRLPCAFIPTSLAFLNFLCVSFLSLILFLLPHL